VFWYEMLSAQEALESGRNPIVGDPDRIAALASRLTITADALRLQNQRLRAVRSDQFWKGEAATAFDSYKEKLPPLLDKVVERYTKVGSALSTYHPQVREAQQLAARALRDYLAAKGAQQIAQTNVQRQQTLQQQALLQRREMVWDGPKPEQQLTAAQDGMQAAIREMAQAIEQRTHTAVTCAATINQAIDDDLKNAAWWKRALSNAGKWMLDRLEKLAPALRTIGGYLGIAALALGWVPVIGEIIIGAALVVNAAALIADAALAASGRKVSTSQLVADAVGVLPLGRMVKAAGGLRALRNVSDLERASQFVSTAARSAGPELRATLSRAGAALDALADGGSGAVVAQTTARLAREGGAVRVIGTHVLDKEIERNTKDFLKNPGAKVSDVVRNPLSIVLPKVPSGAPAPLNPMVEDATALARDAITWAGQHPEVVRTISRVTLPVAVPVAS
jgi:uncharacterized protein YukE